MHRFMTFEEALRNKREEVVHAYLARHPEMHISTFEEPWRRGATLCMSKYRLGAEFVCDFLILQGHAGRWDITLIELEPPWAQPFTKAGNFSKRLNEAIRQVHEWFAWIHNNSTYFRNGLSKRNTDFAAKDYLGELSWVMTCAKIIIGRRYMLTPEQNARRHAVFAESHRQIEIMPYDRLNRAYDYDLYKEDA